VSPEWVEEVKNTLPEMPEEKTRRYTKDLGLSEVDAAVLAESIDVARYFEACVAAGANPARAGNWVRTEVLRALNERQLDADSLPVRPETLAELVRRIDGGELSTTLAKGVFEGLLEGLAFGEALKKSGAVEGGLSAGALEGLIRSILAANPDVVGEIKSGKETKGKKMKFLQGLVMREAKGQARPDDVSAALEAALK
jgi:aspartyl-tRNA(Asn)/glutamyl-tRNA(Gln) amidotransferase subunit B